MHKLGVRNTLLRFLTIIFNTFANLFFLLNACFGLIWFIDYTSNQDNFAPPNELYFTLLTSIALVFKVFPPLFPP